MNANAKDYRNSTSMQTNTLTQLELAAIIERHGLPWEYEEPITGQWCKGHDLTACIGAANLRIAPGTWIAHTGTGRPVRSGVLVDVRYPEGELLGFAQPYGLSWHRITHWRPAETPADPVLTPFELHEHVKRSFPGLRDDHEFHRDDFTAEMLPPGWRPLLKGERTGRDVLHENRRGWAEEDHPDYLRGATSTWLRHRTQRPLPILTPKQVADGWVEWAGGECPVEPESRPDFTLRNGGVSTNQAKNLHWWHAQRDDLTIADIIAYRPDPYDKFRQALADGKMIQCHTFNKVWYICPTPNFQCPPDRYRIVTRQTVPLGPEDVQPFSVIRRKEEEDQWHWRLLHCVNNLSMVSGSRAYTWKEAATDYEINRSLPSTGRWNPDAWEPCSKKIEVVEGGAQ